MKDTSNTKPKSEEYLGPTQNGIKNIVVTHLQEIMCCLLRLF